MNLPQKAFTELYPNRKLPLLFLTYHGKLKGYNATISGTNTKLTFRLSHAFKDSSDEIKIGVMQYLLNRLYKTKHTTLELQLYQDFLKKLTDYAEVNNIDPEIKQRFDIINKEYFDNFMMTPNLIWGSYSLTKLGHYEFSTDTISLSTALREDQDLMDYVLYHEMLHKKLGYSESAGGITRTHTPEFRKLEKQFKIKDIETRLTSFLRSKKRKRRPKTILQRLLNYWEV